MTLQERIRKHHTDLLDAANSMIALFEEGYEKEPLKYAVALGWAMSVKSNAESLAAVIEKNECN